MSSRRVSRLAVLASALVLSLSLVTPAHAAPVTPAPAQPAGSGEAADVTTLKRDLAPTSADLGLPGQPVATKQTRRTTSQERTAAEAAPVVQVAESPVDEAVAVVGVTLPRDTTDATVYLRQVTDGQVGEWEAQELDPSSGDPSVTTTGTAPIVVSDADSVQVAVVSASPVEAQLSVMTSAVSTADAAASNLAWSDPAILSRAAWGADESLVRYGYTYASVTGTMIHHTAGTNSYTADQVPSILRSIQAYHVNGRGWNDIAYNVLVDKFGRAWEGRGGGVERPVQGGHAWQVTNARVFGISLMGDYEQAQPSAASIDTLSRVIAWKFRLHDVDPSGTTWGSGGQDGGSTFLNAISGHRDENATSCPGRYVYAQFPTIKSKVANYMATVYTGTGLEGYRAGMLVTDERFYRANGMTEDEVRSFLADKGAACVPNADGTPCLKDYRVQVPNTAATSFCAALTGGALDAATIISRVGTACGINPQVMIALIQRESGLITATRPSRTLYNQATGSGCPDFMGCDPSQASFFGQVYGAAERFKRYRANPNGYNYRANGTLQSVQYSPEATCGRASFVIENQATAGLYIYTPYTANQASLNAVSGTGDACSSYGNRNFYRNLNSWFPETPRPTGAPVAPSPASTITPAWAAISAKAAEMGPSSTGGALGSVEALPNGGARKAYANQTLYWSPATGAHPISGGIRSRWEAYGAQQGFLGYPATGELCGLLGGGCAQHFQGGTIYWSPATGAIAVTGAVREQWWRGGGEAGALGYPVTDQACGLVRGGCAQHFQGGTIYWSPATGAVAVLGDVRSFWWANGGEGGFLGYPVSAEACGLVGGGCLQHFQGGSVYRSAASGVHWVRGAVRDQWWGVGAERGFLGYPVTDEICGLAGGGCAQHFQGGTVYWSAASGARWLRGAIRAHWWNNGGEGGFLGYPVSNETCGLTAGGCQQQFQGGIISWSPATGAQWVRGGMLGYWLQQGAERGGLGYPRTGEVLMAGGVYQDFQGGRLFWTPERGVHR